MSQRFDLGPLAPELEALLDAERSAPLPPLDAKARLLARLEHSLFDLGGDGGDGGGSEGDAGADGGGGIDGGGSDAGGLADFGADLSGGFDAGAAASTATAAVVKTAAVAGAGMGAKTAVVATMAAVKLTVGVGVASFVAGGAVGAGMHAAISSPPQQQTTIVAERVVPPPAPELPVEPPPPPPVAEPEPEPVPELEAPPPAQRPERVERAAAAPVPTPAPEATNAANDALKAERSLVEQSRSALARGDAAAALAALAEHRQSFPDGRLSEERDALEIQALVARDQMDEAQSRAAAFRENYPTSLLRPAIDMLVE